MSYLQRHIAPRNLRSEIVATRLPASGQSPLRCKWETMSLAVCSIPLAYGARLSEHTAPLHVAHQEIKL